MTQDLSNDTAEVRRKAEVLLQALLDAKAKTEAQLGDSRPSDPLQRVTGKTSLDNAIESTRRMIDTLDRHLAMLRQNPVPAL